jgi:hypothetical protein
MIYCCKGHSLLCHCQLVAINTLFSSIFQNNNFIFQMCLAIKITVENWHHTCKTFFLLVVFILPYLTIEILFHIINCPRIVSKYINIDYSSSLNNIISTILNVVYLTFKLIFLMCQCNGTMDYLWWIFVTWQQKKRFQIRYIGFFGKNDPLKSPYSKEKQFEVTKFRLWLLTSHQNIMWFQCISTFFVWPIAKFG